MGVSLALRTVARRPILSTFGLDRTAQWRYLSTGIPLPDGTLPLEGIRVLDMTRVLAGVSFLGELNCICTVSAKMLISVSIKPYCTQILGDLG